MTFDLEKAREVCKTLPKYMNGACPCKEEAEAAKMLIKALPEIRRLQEFRDRVARILKQPLTDCDDLLILSLDSVICHRRRQAAEIERLNAVIDNPLEELAWKMDRDILNASSDDAEVYLARRWHAAYRKAQNSNLIRAQEIERLRADNTGLSKAVIDIQEERDLAQAEFRAYHKAWEEQAIEIERLRAELASANVELLAAGELVTQLNQAREAEIDQAGAAERMYLEGVRAKDARIKELEEALAEYQRLGKTIAGKVPCLTLHGDCGRCSAKMREVCGALEQIAGGKIGPDVKPRSWQITEERKAAIERLIVPVEILLVDHGTDPEIENAVRLLRAMLEAGQ